MGTLHLYNMLSDEQIRVVLLHEYKLTRCAEVAYHNISLVWGPDAVAFGDVQAWFRKFANGDMSLENEPNDFRTYEI
ncbi:unnamed protein product [Caenorhabditis bovis]|uniref:Mos1 transposase HTH domain-containing protein n=1 Tax=Caenorhabditis bovis TaxID=2654633 RepID=A0A8S1F6F2_9PELO|nr:unnamed protein product [Caenorhabditis bovis]